MLTKSKVRLFVKKRYKNKQKNLICIKCIEEHPIRQKHIMYTGTLLGFTRIEGCPWYTSYCDLNRVLTMGGYSDISDTNRNGANSVRRIKKKLKNI